MTLSPRRTMLTFYGHAGRMVAQYKLLSLPVREDWLVHRCLEIYNDPAPCQMRRTSVVNRLLGELVGFLEGVVSDNDERLDWDEFPLSFREWIDLPNPEAVEIVLVSLT